LRQRSREQVLEAHRAQASHDKVVGLARSNEELIRESLTNAPTAPI
jgi:hypothetical protein